MYLNNKDQVWLGHLIFLNEQIQELFYTIRQNPNKLDEILTEEIVNLYETELAKSTDYFGENLEDSWMKSYEVNK